MGQLEGKVAIVTGASSGIGQGVSRLFAAEGARVVVTARRETELERLVAEIDAAGGVACYRAGDIRDETLASALVDLAVERHGGLDIAVNNAGTLGTPGPVTGISASAWQDTIDINLTGAFFGAKHQVPALVARGGGALLFTSTFVGHTVGLAHMAAYGASKAGLVGLARVLAAELGGYGIRVNAILPGGTNTEMAGAYADDPEARAQIAGMHALKRIAEPEEIARAMLYLASDAGSFVTGTAMAVDGGVSSVRG